MAKDPLALKARYERQIKNADALMAKAAEQRALAAREMRTKLNLNLKAQRKVNNPKLGKLVRNAVAKGHLAKLIDGGAEKDLESRQQAADDLHLVMPRVARQPRVVDGNLLQAQHVEAGLQGVRAIDDALRAGDAVIAAAPLVVPSNEVHSAVWLRAELRTLISNLDCLPLELLQRGELL